MIESREVGHEDEAVMVSNLVNITVSNIAISTIGNIEKYFFLNTMLQLLG